MININKFEFVFSFTYSSSQQIFFCAIVFSVNKFNSEKLC